MIAACTGSFRNEHQTDYQELVDSSGGVEAEYQRVVALALQRWGVPADCATVDIQQLPPEQGKDVFIAIVRLVSWNRNAVLRVLIGLPLLDKKVRQEVEALWVADVSVFNGVLLTVSQSLRESEPTSELRRLLVSLTGPRKTYQPRTGESAKDLAASVSTLA